MHGDAEAPRDDRVRELVQEHRREEEQRGREGREERERRSSSRGASAGRTTARLQVIRTKMKSHE